MRMGRRSNMRKKSRTKTEATAMKARGIRSIGMPSSSTALSMTFRLWATAACSSSSGTNRQRLQPVTAMG
jgi:hypothetical protein